ncbi:hypothetical protein CLOM_g15490 [Closterium sp. NIES-68]|nr:hypothetical protein CLOM_g15490 [Closterium sp. NIES-68]
MSPFSSGSHGIFQTGFAIRILADKNGGQFHPQNCLPNSVRIVRVSGNGVRTHQRTTFQAKMNHILRSLLDNPMEGYLDEILIYSRDMKQDVEHLRRVFDILQRERFYVKLSKREFALEKVQFL